MIIKSFILQMHRIIYHPSVCSTLKALCKPIEHGNKQNSMDVPER